MRNNFHKINPFKYSSNGFKFPLMAFLTLAVFSFWLITCKKDVKPSSITSMPSTELADDRAVCCTYHIDASIVPGGCPAYRYDLDLFVYTKGLQACSYALNQNYVKAGTNGFCIFWTWEKNTSNVYHLNFNLPTSPSTQLSSIAGCGTGTVAHHIIPIQLCNSFGTISSAINLAIEKAGRDGFHPQEGYNCYCVPSANHSGSHPNYTNWIAYELDRFNTKKPTASFRLANTFVQCTLIPKLRIEIAKAITQNKTINEYFGTLAQANLQN